MEVKSRREWWEKMGFFFCWLRCHRYFQMAKDFVSCGRKKPWLQWFVESILPNCYDMFFKIFSFFQKGDRHHGQMYFWHLFFFFRLIRGFTILSWQFWRMSLRISGHRWEADFMTSGSCWRAFSRLHIQSFMSKYMPRLYPEGGPGYRAGTNSTFSDRLHPRITTDLKWPVDPIVLETLRT